MMLASPRDYESKNNDLFFLFYRDDPCDHPDVIIPKSPECRYMKILGEYKIHPLRTGCRNLAKFLALATGMVAEVNQASP